MAVSPDGLWLYVVSAAKSHTAAFGPSEGLVSVLSIQKLETKPEFCAGRLRRRPAAARPG